MHREEGSSSLLVVACAALFGLAVGLAILSAVLSSRLEEEQGRRERVTEASGRFATALLTYDYQNLDASKNRVLALSTEKFKREYEQAFNAGLAELLTRTKAASQGTVTGVYVGQVEAGRADVITVVRAVATGSAARRTVNSFIQLQLVEVGGRWRVDGVTNLNVGQEQDRVLVPTPTTTAPSRRGAPPQRTTSTVRR